MSAPRTARERVREEMTTEILTVARDHLAREGAVALSLRSVARDLGMAPSALYRYFDGRDALLSALILSAYESLATEVERAAAVADSAGGGDGKKGARKRATGRWLVVPRAMRAWALAHPHEWALVFGTPVPGYEAPEETIAPYARIVLAMARPVTEAADAGRLQVDPAGPGDGLSPAALRGALAPVIEGVFPDLPLQNVVAVVEVWSMLVGVISLELFGHWRNTILDPDLFFEAAIRNAAKSIGLS